MSNIYSYAGYCLCGDEIWIEYLHSGTTWIHRFFDQTHKEITICPGCGNRLKEYDLESK